MEYTTERLETNCPNSTEPLLNQNQKVLRQIPKLVPAVFNLF